MNELLSLLEVLLSDYGLLSLLASMVGAILHHCYTLAVTNKLVYMIQPYRLCYLVVLMYIDDVKMRPGS